ISTFAALTDPFFESVGKMSGTPSRPNFYQQFIRGFVAKNALWSAVFDFPRTSEKPPVSAVLAGGFCSNYATKALILSNS
ncbi:MAG: hypothetical protein PUD49_03785, partial [Collinsella sp.]|nr:hypothetical protein [Collinsella sp.]